MTPLIPVRETALNVYYTGNKQPCKCKMQEMLNCLYIFVSAKVRADKTQSDKRCEADGTQSPEDKFYKMICVKTSLTGQLYFYLIDLSIVFFPKFPILFFNKCLFT